MNHEEIPQRFTWLNCFSPSHLHRVFDRQNTDGMGENIIFFGFLTILLHTVRALGADSVLANN